MNRRNFLKFTLITSATPLLADQEISRQNSQMMSIIDLDLCDGCEGFEVPKCISACKTHNKDKFPDPKKPIMNYWPQKKYEDYSDKKDIIDRLTPYNWTYVQKIEINGKKINIPRRCMHCDNPPCQKLCPFGVISKDKYGAVDIDKDFCFGGTKCRDACPWQIPQRQAGVGLYLNIAPKLAGGGVMYKCDMCKDLLNKGDKPACQNQCPKKAIKFAPKNEIMSIVNKENRHIYGLKENGGTSTIYLSSVDFESINEAITKKYENLSNKIGRPHMARVDSPLQKSENLAMAVMITPLAAIGAATISAIKWNKKDK